MAEDSELDGWKGKYARVGVDILLSTEVARDHLAITRIDDITRPEGTPMTEVFGPDLGIVVLGKENMEEASCTIDMIRVMIQEHGIRLLPNTTAVLSPSDPKPFTGNLAIRPCSPDISDDLGQFCFLLANAEQQRYLPARFLILYQIIEALISRLYENAVRALMSDPLLLKNVWELREEFEKISSEKSRMNKLFNDYLVRKPPEYHKLTEDVKEACIAFLEKADPAIAVPEKEGGPRPPGSATLTQKGWVEILYRCRNLIVHRQWQMKSVAEPELSRVCGALKQIHFLALSCYVASPM